MGSYREHLNIELLNLPESQSVHDQFELPGSRSEPESQRAPVILPNNLWPAPGLWQCR